METNRTSTGYKSTGYKSTGSHSTGNFSTGNNSTGSWSTGSHSTGFMSTGDYSISNYSTGAFSTVTPEYTVFDEPCEKDIFRQWLENEAPSWLKFELTEWIDKENMTDEEKQDHPEHSTTGGYLKVYDYQEAFQKSYNNAPREEQLKILTCPNFNADKFYEISGIRIGEE